MSASVAVKPFSCLPVEERGETGDFSPCFVVCYPNWHVAAGCALDGEAFVSPSAGFGVSLNADVLFRWHCYSVQLRCSIVDTYSRHGYTLRTTGSQPTIRMTPHMRGIMGEQQQQQVPQHKPSWHDLTTFLRFWLQLIRTRHDPKAFEQIVEKLAQESGIPPTDIPTMRHAFIAVRDAAKERTPPFVDLYLVGGMGAINLILLQVLLSAGVSDTPLSVSLFLLVFSLPLTAMSLFFSFLKQKYTIPTYGKIHSTLSFLALVTGTLALDGAIWHISRVDGIVFFCIAVAMYLWAGFYLVLIQTALRFIALQKPTEAEKNEHQ